MWLLVQWTGFSYLQGLCFFMSCVVLTTFLMYAAIGLLLHFFTNMFAVTAILGSGAAVFANFKKIENVVNTVHGEISHASIIMDHLKDTLTRKVIELALAEKKNARNAQKIAAAEDHQNTFMGNFADVDEGGDGLIGRAELEKHYGKMSDREWKKYDGNNDGTITLAEWEASKASRLARRAGRSEEEVKKLARGFLAVDQSGDGALSRDEFEAAFGRMSDDEWALFDTNGDGVVTLEEWQARKMESVQKGVLLIRSAFEHCVQKELSDAGFDKTRILIGSVIALVTVVITLGIVYFAMKTANAMGAMSAMLSSGVSAVAIGILNMPKKQKDETKLDPQLEKAVGKLNLALQTTITDAIGDLCAMLRFFPVLFDLMEAAIEDAEKNMLKLNKDKSKSLQKNASEMIKTARTAFKNGKSKWGLKA